MKVIWSPEALAHRREIALFIATDDREAAKRLVRTFEEKAKQLGRFPNLGKIGRVANTRELLVHKHYFIVYDISDDIVNILALWHTSQQYPPIDRKAD